MHTLWVGPVSVSGIEYPGIKRINSDFFYRVRCQVGFFFSTSNLTYQFSSIKLTCSI
ncbi:hypothetical protein HanIR_Chr15g0779811 [Helianthus annuus]|nr:hypothetical protein HanIR_Chr15g0779811 [Helianthus annuus]